MNEFPQELHIEILKYLPIRELIVLAQGNRYFRTLLKNEYTAKKNKNIHSIVEKYRNYRMVAYAFQSNFNSRISFVSCSSIEIVVFSKKKDKIKLKIHHGCANKKEILTLGRLLSTLVPKFDKNIYEEKISTIACMKFTDPEGYFDVSINGNVYSGHIGLFDYEISIFATPMCRKHVKIMREIVLDLLDDDTYSIHF